MKKPVLGGSDLAAPKHQQNWDWRAATNFIVGGAGGALLLFAAMGGFEAAATRTAILLALVLIGCGLTCVWFEIGRPWRALNVYRHFASSWMTREAVVALMVFAAGGLALLLLWPLLVWLSAAAGLAFLYSQARILAANKGIPAWRHPRSVYLMVVTGLTEGAGLLACVASLSASPIGFWHLAGLLALIAIRAFIWKGYLAGLTADGAPEASLRVLNGIDTKLLVLGHVLPGLAVAAALAGMPGRGVWLFAAGIMVVASGWLLKYTLVRRAAFTQGLALLRLPVRGGGPAGPATKPGWKSLQDAKAG
ncbi:MAG: dimethyl sulfoxide reductase anchor subunit [Sulfuritalea sp.]|jgi:phenylacetyl-CoA:acceptor oxidoreductase subunit 2|nr:dimethyl sulfoxide reductase anchor subunit [Sulfuritalea sp.]